MKSIYSPLFVSGLMLLLSTFACSKKEAVKPTDNSAPVAPVYDARNNAPIYPTTGMVFDAAGNLYLADQSNNNIKRITPTGTVTVFAGSGTRGASNGSAASASFSLPSSLAMDVSGNIYVADAGNNLIRKITPDGNVSTLAGSGKTGSANGQGLSASFNFPQGIAVDKAGNVYVADTGNDMIRKITPDGNVTTLAGRLAAGSANGTGTQATFNIPQGLSIDSKGNVYVADAGNNYLRMITPDGVVSTFVEDKFTSSALGTIFSFPDALAVDNADNLYVTEAGGNDVKGIPPAGLPWKLSIDWGTPFNGKNSYVGPSPLVNGVSSPNGIAVDQSGHILVADYGNNRIVIADQ